MGKKDSVKQKETIKKEIKEETNAVEKINEKSINEIPKEVVKKRLNKIYFEPLQYEEGNVNKKYHHYNFIYDDKIKTVNNDIVKYYILNLKKKIWTSLNLRKILKDFEMAMYLNDNNANGDIDVKNELPRKVKMERVKQMYELLVEITLNLLHNLFYIDLKYYTENTYTIEECLKVAEPMIFSIKSQLETQVNNELSLTTDEKKALTG